MTAETLVRQEKTVHESRFDAARVASALDLLDGSSASLVEASHAGEVAQRYVIAQLAALRAAAAVLAVRGPQLIGTRSTGGPRNLWELLPAVAPELREWAEFFAHTATRRWAVDEGRQVVSVREADDLVRSAGEFHDRVRRLLGLTRAAEPLRLTPALS
ncbi:hypothetical protein GCM10009810_33640 [Nostocoides vanveenii]|jgi:hypothetical protein|uniref:SAV-6107-like HEPN domain-containing protein n=1 Tax=Nostocoides vanveenii TaxID=330835 RepID=A0ABN2L4H1_9MICO